MINNINDSRILVFGDTHGRSVWRYIVEKEGIDNLDLIIFLGDYFTSREGISVEDQEENFKRIVKFKEKYPDKVVLLRGNHDMEACKYSWSGCWPSHDSNWVKNNREYFLSNTQWCLQIGSVLFSHAGITKTWFEILTKFHPEVKEFNDINNVEPSNLFKFRPDNFSDNHGDSKTQPLTWVRPGCLYTYGFKDIKYVVGHTTTFAIHEYEPDSWMKKDGCSIWLCDALPKEYLIIDHGEFIAKEVGEFE